MASVEQADAVVLRGMTFKDVPAVRRLNLANSTENFLMATFLRTLAASYTTSFVAEAGGRVVGYVEAVACARGSKGHIYSICVDGPFRRRGIGSRLLARAVESIRAELGRQGSVDLHVRVSNTGAIAMYRSAGFVVRQAGIPYYEGGELAHRMSLVLGDETDAEAPEARRP